MHTPVNNFHENHDHHHHLTYDAITQDGKKIRQILRKRNYGPLVKIVSWLNSYNGRYRYVINYALHNIYKTNIYLDIYKSIISLDICRLA